jgi:hypothetical protein
MGSRGQVPLKQIWKMLKKCHPDYRVETKTHQYWVYANGRVFKTLPLGPHGKRQNPGIEIGHVRKMVRYLRLDSECAAQHIPLLR